jgi:hypothetical protein
MLLDQHAAKEICEIYKGRSPHPRPFSLPISINRAENIAEREKNPTFEHICDEFFLGNNPFQL